jgi:pyruvate dehydrogenase E2 component (dihydrolipoamide acetyltransferase)
MASEIRLPQIAESMTAAKLAVWLKREGDSVTEGEPIAEVETDKASMEIPAPASGVLKKIEIPAGTDDLHAGDLLAVITDRVPGQSAEGHDEPQPSTGGPTRPPEEPRATDLLARSHESSAIPTRAAGERADPRRTADVPRRSVAATPLARRMAEMAGIDLAALEPEIGRRIGKVDVERAIVSRTGAVRPRASQPPVDRASSMTIAGTFAGPAPAPFRDVALSPARRVTAVRMRQSKEEIPHFYLHIDCNVAALMDLRERINTGGHARLTVTDFLIRAAALALRKVPEANASWSETGVRVYDRADIAVAVSTPQGLITPVIRGADGKSLDTISREMKALSQRARAGQLQPAEYNGGTFTLSNLGMYGVTSLSPIISPPQSCILGVGAVEPRPIVIDGQVTVGRVVSCTLAADHRALDGDTGARFLAALRRHLEEPFSAIFEG